MGSDQSSEHILRFGSSSSSHSVAVACAMFSMAIGVLLSIVDTVFTVGKCVAWLEEETKCGTQHLVMLVRMTNCEMHRPMEFEGATAVTISLFPFDVDVV